MAQAVALWRRVAAPSISCLRAVVGLGRAVGRALPPALLLSLLRPAEPRSDPPPLDAEGSDYRPATPLSMWAAGLAFGAMSPMKEETT
jgi:hypothetical protein